MIKLGALWAGNGKEGSPVLSGQINGDVRIVIFKNGYKTEDKHPDYLLYIEAAERKEKPSVARSPSKSPVAVVKRPRSDFNEGSGGNIPF